MAVDEIGSSTTAEAEVPVSTVAFAEATTFPAHIAPIWSSALPREAIAASMLDPGGVAAILYMDGMETAVEETMELWVEKETNMCEGERTQST